MIRNNLVVTLSDKEAGLVCGGFNFKQELKNMVKATGRMAQAVSGKYVDTREEAKRTWQEAKEALNAGMEEEQQERNAINSL